MPKVAAAQSAAATTLAGSEHGIQTTTMKRGWCEASSAIYAIGPWETMASLVSRLLSTILTRGMDAARVAPEKPVSHTASAPPACRVRYDHLDSHRLYRHRSVASAPG